MSTAKWQNIAGSKKIFSETNKFSLGEWEWLILQKMADSTKKWPIPKLARGIGHSKIATFSRLSGYRNDPIPSIL